MDAATPKMFCQGCGFINDITIEGILEQAFLTCDNCGLYLALTRENIINILKLKGR